jgi:hypothetical protein
LLALLAAGAVACYDRTLVSFAQPAQGRRAALGAAMLSPILLSPENSPGPRAGRALFGRMLSIGIVTRYLDEHCPDPRLRSASARRIAGRHRRVLLGQRAVQPARPFDGLNDEMRTIALGRARLRPAVRVPRCVLGHLANQGRDSAASAAVGTPTA